MHMLQQLTPIPNVGGSTSHVLLILIQRKSPIYSTWSCVLLCSCEQGKKSRIMRFWSLKSTPINLVRNPTKQNMVKENYKLCTQLIKSRRIWICHSIDVSIYRLPFQVFVQNISSKLTLVPINTIINAIFTSTCNCPISWKWRHVLSH